MRVIGKQQLGVVTVNREEVGQVRECVSLYVSYGMSNYERVGMSAKND